MSAVGVEVLRYWWDDYKKGQYIQLQYTVTKGCIVLSQVVNKSAYVGNANTPVLCARKPLLSTQNFVVAFSFAA